MLDKQQKRYRRHKRIKAEIFGTAKRPRLYVFRSNKHIYAQIIDDENGRTLFSVSDSEFKKNKKPKIEEAKEMGKLIAKKAKNLPAGRQVEKLVFDRGGYKYHGKVKAIAEGAREGGLKF